MTPHPYNVTILFLDYEVIIFDDVNPLGIVTSLCPCVPVAEPHPDDVTILFLDYDVILFDDVNPLGYCDVTVSLCPCCRTLCLIINMMIMMMMMMMIVT